MTTYPWLHLVFAVLTLLSITAVGLLAIWAALGRGHWFVRVAAVGALLSLLLLVPAYEPLIVFVIQSAVAVPILAMARRLRARSKGEALLKFGPRDLLLLTAVVAAVAAIGVITPKKVWQSWDVIGCMGISHVNPAIAPWLYTLILAATMGTVTCLAAWIVLGRCRRWKRLTVLFIVFPAVLMGLGVVFRSGSLWPRQPPPEWVRIFGEPKIDIDELVFLYAICSLVLMVVWLWLARASGSEPGSREVEDASKEKKHAWLRWLARGGLLLLSLTILIPLGWAYWIMVTPLPIPKTVLPEPNGYTRLVDLGRQLENVAVPEDDEFLPLSERAKPKDFIDFERQYHELLATAHRSLDLPSSVPVRYDEYDMDTTLTDFQATRQLARAMNAAGHAACLRGDYEEGARRYVDTIRLGRRVARGGLFIHWLVGLAVEGIGVYGIHTELASMPGAQRAALIATLANLKEEWESLGAVKHRDDVWTQNAYGWPGRLVHQVFEQSGSNAAIFEACRNALNRNRTQFRILLVELALENYRDAHGRYPERLEELVPEQLDELPLDPGSDAPLRYRLTDEGYLLYGVGANGQDDSGATMNDDPAADDVRFQ